MRDEKGTANPPKRLLLCVHIRASDHSAMLAALKGSLSPTDVSFPEIIRVFVHSARSKAQFLSDTLLAARRRAKRFVTARSE